MKILRVGDPHAKVANLEEMKSLISFIVKQAKLHHVDRIEILGDLFHTHNVIRLEVIEFWNWAFDLLSETCETIILVGNHDVSGNYNSNFSALSIFALIGKKNIKIIEKPTKFGVFGYVPYTHNNDAFIAAANRLADEGATVLVIHQTIQGSKYDTGIYAPDGIPSEQWAERFIHVISGHIHSEQSFGNIIYPGTARWDTISDANRRKGIWIYEHGDAVGSSSGTVAPGAILSADFISTDGVCSPIQHIEYREGSPAPEWRGNARVAVELIGSSAWIANEKPKFVGRCSIKTTVTDKKMTNVRKTGKNFEQFIKEFFVSSMDKDGLLAYAKEIGIV